MIYFIMIVLALWIAGGCWYFLENMGKKWRKVNRVRDFFEWILLAPSFIFVILPLSLHTQYRDYKHKSKITSP